MHLRTFRSRVSTGALLVRSRRITSAVSLDAVVLILGFTTTALALAAYFG